VIFSESEVNVSDGDGRWGLGFETSCSFSEAGSSTMKDLDKEMRSFFMNSINNLFPPLHMLLIEQVGSTWESLSTLTPRNTFSEHESCTRSLTVIFADDISGDTIQGITSLTSEGGKDDSVLESVFAELDLIGPV
jgi:hypothetical protein